MISIRLSRALKCGVAVKQNARHLMVNRQSAPFLSSIRPCRLQARDVVRREQTKVCDYPSNGPYGNVHKLSGKSDKRNANGAMSADLMSGSSIDWLDNPSKVEV